MNKPLSPKETLLADLRLLRQQPGWERFQGWVQRQLASALTTERRAPDWNAVCRARGQSEVLERVVAWWENEYQETLTAPSRDFGGEEHA